MCYNTSKMDILYFLVRNERFSDYILYMTGLSSLDLGSSDDCIECVESKEKEPAVLSRRSRIAGSCTSTSLSEDSLWEKVIYY